METAKCGTRSGYNRHIRLKQIACDACKLANRKWVSEWSKNNPDRTKEINKKARDKYRARPEIQQKRIEDGRKYLQTENGKEAAARSNSRRRAHKMNAASEKYTTQDVLNFYGNICHICNITIDLSLPRKVGHENWQMGLQLDHVIPISKGGNDSLDNVRPSHGICNKKKSDKI